MEPLAVAWHAVNISPFKKGDSVLILGGGPIGLAVVQVLKARGAKTIIVSEMAPRRKEFAKQFGAHYVLDPSKDDVVARVKDICDGRGVNVAFDAAGVVRTFQSDCFLFGTQKGSKTCRGSIFAYETCLTMVTIGLKK